MALKSRSCATSIPSNFRRKCRNKHCTVLVGCGKDNRQSRDRGLRRTDTLSSKFARRLVAPPGAKSERTSFDRDVAYADINPQLQMSRSELRSLRFEGSFARSSKPVAESDFADPPIHKNGDADIFRHSQPDLTDSSYNGSFHEPGYGRKHDIGLSNSPVDV